MKSKYTDEFLQEVYEYMIQNKMGITALAKHFGVDRHVLKDKLSKKYGYVISRPKGKKDINENFFENIDTEEKAYWLGFLTADGYLSDDNSLQLCLAEKDRKHIEKFKQNIESSHKISLKQATINNKTINSYRISINNKKIASDLRKLGFNNNKSYECYIPFENIPKSLLHHYIRGLMDGDGCVVNYETKYNKKHVRLTICTTVSCQLINDITLCLEEELSINVKYRIGKNKKPVDIIIGKQKDVKKFYDWIYKDATIYLDRKYDKFAVLKQKEEDN